MGKQKKSVICRHQITAVNRWEFFCCLRICACTSLTRFCACGQFHGSAAQVPCTRSFSITGPWRLDKLRSERLTLLNQCSC